VYLITAFIVEYCGPKVRAVIAATLLIGYWLVLRYYPVPGYGPGNLTTDGNLAGYIDRALMYNHLYITHRFDPEGVLSTFPAIATCLLGVFTGEWIRDKRGETLIRTLLVGAVFGLGLGKVWNMWFPINKNLWTSSYVLFTAGFALAVLAFCYWTIDTRSWKKWALPFVWYGLNPLALYFFAGWLAHTTTLHVGGRTIKDIIYGGLYAHLTGNSYFNSMLYGLTYVLLCLLVAWVLYRKKIVIKV
jgi:predicted acyltransferase